MVVVVGYPSHVANCSDMLFNRFNWLSIEFLNELSFSGHWEVSQIFNMHLKALRVLVERSCMCCHWVHVAVVVPFIHSLSCSVLTCIVPHSVGGLRPIPLVEFCERVHAVISRHSLLTRQVPFGLALVFICHHELSMS